MVGGKDRDPDASRQVADDLDTTTWRGGVAAPRIANDPPPDSPSEGRAVSRSAETVVTESGAAMADQMDLNLTADATPTVVPVVFERIEPSAKRGEKIRLDPSLHRIRVGRSETNEFRLHAPSTSRKHAVIERDFTGHWVLTPLAGKSMKVDGYSTSEPVVLEPGMNLVLGGDHLRCLSGEALEETMIEAPRFDESPSASSGWEDLLRSRTMLGAAILFGVGLGVLLWLRG